MNTVSPTNQSPPRPTSGTTLTGQILRAPASLTNAPTGTSIQGQVTNVAANGITTVQTADGEVEIRPQAGAKPPPPGTQVTLQTQRSGSGPQTVVLSLLKPPPSQPPSDPAARQTPPTAPAAQTSAAKPELAAGRVATATVLQQMGGSPGGTAPSPNSPYLQQSMPNPAPASVVGRALSPALQLPGQIITNPNTSIGSILMHQAGKAISHLLAATGSSTGPQTPTGTPTSTQQQPSPSAAPSPPTSGPVTPQTGSGSTSNAAAQGMPQSNAQGVQPDRPGQPPNTGPSPNTGTAAGRQTSSVSAEARALAAPPVGGGTSGIPSPQPSGAAPSTTPAPTSTSTSTSSPAVQTPAAPPSSPAGAGKPISTAASAPAQSPSSSLSTNAALAPPISPPTGSAFSVRITAVTPPAGGSVPPQLAALTNTATQIAAGPEQSGAQIKGHVVGNSANGLPVVQTPLGIVSLDVRGPVPLNTQISFEAIENTVRANAASEKQAAPLAVLARGWPSLDEAIEALNLTDPAAATHLQQTAVLRPGGQMSSMMMFFLSAVRGGDLKSLLGQKSLSDLEKIGQGRLTARLGEEFRALNKASEPSDTGWRAFFVPVQDGGETRQIGFYVNSDKTKDRDSDGDQDRTHFMIDLTLSQLGPFQIDGLAEKNNLDLVVRTGTPLPGDMRKAIHDLFHETLSGTGIEGSLTYRVQSPQPVPSLDELSSFENAARSGIIA